MVRLNALRAHAKVILSMVFSLTFAYKTWANPSQELHHFFNNLGFASNVTNPTAYRTQAAGYLSSGSVYARGQVRNIQIAHIDVPGFRSGCGGIDILAGGFSFISGDQIVQFMQSVLTAGAGFAFTLALDTEMPEAGGAMKFVQKLAHEVNSFNLNSCEMGELLGGALYPKNRGASQKICESIGLKSGYFADWAKAKHGCSTGGEIESQLDKAKSDPEYKDQVLYNKNVIWDALQKNAFLRQNPKLAEAYMSISGTLVFDKKGQAKTYPSLVHHQDLIKALLYGGRLPSYQCKDSGNQNLCLLVDYADSSHQTIRTQDSLVYQVQELLQGIYNNIRSGTALSKAQEGLINLSEDAIFKLIASNAQQGLGIEGSYGIAQQVASDLLAHYLANSLSVIRSSLVGQDLGKDNEAILLANLQEAQGFVEGFAKESRARLNQSLQTNHLIQANVKQAYQSLSPLLQRAYQESSA